jgi:hypothetical protein
VRGGGGGVVRPYINTNHQHVCMESKQHSILGVRFVLAL